VIWALAVDGASGVSDVLTALTAELAHTMTLCGLSDVRSVPRDAVLRARSAP
jgi:4-hydroxymandelate oxidase